MMKMFLDTDLNFPSDDFQALMLLLAAKEVQIVGIGAAAGNTWSEEVFANVQQAAHMLELRGLPIFRGIPADEFATDRSMALRLYQEGHRNFIGAHGKSNSPRPWVTQEWPCDLSPSASDGIIALSQHAGGDLILVCLGPLSNLARALDIDPTLPNRIKVIYVMGGNFPAQGEPQRRIDFNFWFDPKAAQIVLNSGIEIILIPLDVCQQACVNQALTDRFANFDQNRAELFFDDLLGMLRQHGLSMPLADQLVALICQDQSLIEIEERARVEVDCSNHSSRGTTRLFKDPSGSVRVVRQVDVVGAHEKMIKLVAKMTVQRSQAYNHFGSPAYQYLQGVHLAQNPLDVIELEYDQGYSVRGAREIRSALEMAEVIAPLAQILIEAKKRGELWPPSPRVDAVIDRFPEATKHAFDHLARKELEHILFERFMAVRAIATIAPDGDRPRGFSCISELLLERQRFLKYQFGEKMPKNALLAEFSYVERRTSGLWASEVLGSTLLHWYATMQSSSDSFPILGITLATQEASRNDLVSSGFEPIAEHTIPDGPEQGRVLILHQLIFDSLKHQDLLKRYETLGVQGLERVIHSIELSS